MYFDIKKLYYTTSIGCYGFVSKFKILKQNMICFSFEGGGGYTFMGMYLHGTVTANRMEKKPSKRNSFSYYLGHGIKIMLEISSCLEVASFTFFSRCLVNS